MTTLKERYDLARQNQKACQRAVFAAVDAKDPPDVLVTFHVECWGLSPKRARIVYRAF